MDIVSRSAARDAGRPRYFTGVACSKGHIAERYTSTGNCRECQKSYSSTYGQAARAVIYRNFDARRAELLEPGLHVPPDAHAEIYAYIDMVLSRYGRPPCGFPRTAAAAPVAPVDPRTEWERMHDLQARFGRYKVDLLCSRIPETHSPGWVPAPVMGEEPHPVAYSGANKPDYLP